MDNKEMEMKAREHDMTAIDAEGAEEVVQKIRSQYVFAYLFGSVATIIE